jgi:hypothetical protein
MNQDNFNMFQSPMMKMHTSASSSDLMQITNRSILTNIPQEYLSFYIPRVLWDVTEDSIRIQLSPLFGKVIRVDFTPIHKKPGFIEHLNPADKYKSAFVHFAYFYEKCWIRQCNSFVHVEELVRSIYEDNNPFRYYHENGAGFWLLVKNYKPIPVTLMNVHQIVDNGRLLEERLNTLEPKINLLEQDMEFYGPRKSAALSDISYQFSQCFESIESCRATIETQHNTIVAQQETIRTLRSYVDIDDKRIEQLEKKTENMSCVIYQLLGGLFHQEKQEKVLGILVDILHGENEEYWSNANENDTESIWPTTRQGDDHEKRIEMIERMLVDLKMGITNEKKE